MPGGMKTASYTVRADLECSVRWNRAASSESFPSTGAWLAHAANCYLRMIARGSRPIALGWKRGWFVVALEAGEKSVPGQLSPPFAIFRGSAHGLTTAHSFSLVHAPTKRILATFNQAREAKALAAELAPVLLRDEAETAKISARREIEKT